MCLVISFQADKVKNGASFCTPKTRYGRELDRAFSALDLGFSCIFPLLRSSQILMKYGKKLKAKPRGCQGTIR